MSYLEGHFAMISDAWKWPSLASFPVAVTSTSTFGTSRNVSGTTHCEYLTSISAPFFLSRKRYSQGIPASPGFP